MEENKMIAVNGETKPEKAVAGNPRIRRVGTVTCGIVLMIFGAMFLLHTILPIIGYGLIFRMWPLILIILGLEILAGSITTQKETGQFVYDFPAVILIMLVAFFAMVMGVIDYAMQTGAIWIQDGSIWIQ